MCSLFKYFLFYHWNAPHSVVYNEEKINILAF